MDVIGYEDDDDYDDDDDVQGDVMGFYDPNEDLDDDDDVQGDVMGIVGYDDSGGPIIVGKRRRRRRRRRGRKRHSVHVRKMRWRRSQLAPGVIAPDQGLLPLPLTGNPSNTFTAAVQNITFEGRVQKPFRPERLLVSTVRSGTTATGRLLGNIFNGTDLQQLDTSAFDLELVGATTAFGVRMAMKPVQPGVTISIPTTLSVVLTSTDTIIAQVILMGRNIH
jgi:hypothetical protein